MRFRCIGRHGRHRLLSTRSSQSAKAVATSGEFGRAERAIRIGGTSLDGRMPESNRGCLRRRKRCARRKYAAWATGIAMANRDHIVRSVKTGLALRFFDVVVRMSAGGIAMFVSVAGFMADGCTRCLGAKRVRVGNAPEGSGCQEQDRHKKAYVSCQLHVEPIQGSRNTYMRDSAITVKHKAENIALLMS